jgi:hypothetical protein
MTETSKKAAIESLIEEISELLEDDDLETIEYLESEDGQAAMRKSAGELVHWCDAYLGDDVDDEDDVLSQSDGPGGSLELRRE